MIQHQHHEKTRGSYNELSADYGFTFDKRNRSFMPTSGSVSFDSHCRYMLINPLYQIYLELVPIKC